MKNLTSKAVTFSIVLQGLMFSLASYAQQDFYPVTPCRIMDTRVAEAIGNGNGALLGGGDERSAFVLETGTTDISGQGGLPGGCGIPEGATAVHINLTAVNPLGFGYLRVYPYIDGGPQVEPNATVLVWYPGISISNALTVASCVTEGGYCNFDLNYKSYGTGTDLAVEVLGYYLPAVVMTALPESVESTEETFNYQELVRGVK